MGVVQDSSGTDYGLSYRKPAIHPITRSAVGVCKLKDWTVRIVNR